MKKKILGIFLCMLLIVTAIPVVGIIENDNLTICETSDDYDNSLRQFTNSNCNPGDWLEQAKLLASDGVPDDGFGISVSIDGEYALIGAAGDDDSKGSAYVFKRSGLAWIQECKLTASDGADEDYFGYSVSIDGDYALIGSYGDDTSKGSAYVFKRSGTSWIQEDKLTASDGGSGDSFGWSVSISGEYAIVGVPGYDNSTGSVYVFKHSGSYWVEEDKLIASDSEPNDAFGWSVSLDLDYALIGALGDDYYVGSAYVFKRSGSTWVQEAKLIGSGSYGDLFGYSVSIDGEYALVGVPSWVSIGLVYVYKRSGLSWMQEDILAASDGTFKNFFGWSVSTDGKYAIIGAVGVENYMGSAYVFKRYGIAWSEEAKLTASDGESDDGFGYSVSIDSNYALIGADMDDTCKGSAYVFKKPIPDLDCLGTLSWTDISPGDTVTSSFMVANNGDIDSELSWEIESNPMWGTWKFLPSNGSGLTPVMGALTVAVEVVAPNEKNKEFTGEVKVVNTEDSSDYHMIHVSLTTPKDKSFIFNFPLLNWLFERFPNIFPVLKQLFEC